MAKKVAMVFGVIFLILGVLGFIPNPIVGDDGAVFHTDMMHNLVHIVLGIVLIWAGKKGGSTTVLTLKVVGVIYLVVAVLGFLMGEGSILGLMEVNGADNWLHLVVAILFLWAGFAKGGSSSAPMGQPMV